MATSPSTTDLIDFLKANPAETNFVPYTLLSKEADTLTVYFEPDADYSKRLNDHLTLFLAVDEPNKIVGCRIKGIASILNDLPNFITARHNGVELSIVFLSFRGGAGDEATRTAINSLGQVAARKNMKVEPCLA